MSNYVVVEIRAWLLLVLVVVVVLAALAVGAWLLLRWIRKNREEAAERERQQVEADAVHRRNRMLVRLDHELKNPLTALRTSLATLRGAVDDDAPDPRVVGSAVKQIDSSARRVARLLADLRKLADVESRSIDFQRVDMDRLVQQAVEDARTAPGAEDRMIVATVARAPWKLPAVAGEEDLLLSAVLNLLGNALKYSSDTDTVELRANEQIIDQHRWVVVEVADTGSGIPVEEQTVVWDELQRGTKVRSVAGSGMGLSLVKAIIARHGGTVELFSQEGVGTSVRLVLPVMGDALLPGQTGGARVPGADMAHVAAGSRAVQPFQGQQAGQSAGAGAPRFLPPREPSHDERRFMGTPRRGSRRRIQTIDGRLFDTSTGESFGGGPGADDHAGTAGGSGAGGSAAPPFDSGPYGRFKPPSGTPEAGIPGAPPNGTSPSQNQVPQNQIPQSNSGPHPAQGPDLRQQQGSGPRPQGSGPLPQQLQGSGPPPSVRQAPADAQHPQPHLRRPGRSARPQPGAPDPSVSPGVGPRPGTDPQEEAGDPAAPRTDGGGGRH